MASAPTRATGSEQIRDGGQIRETCEEFDLGASSVTMLSDPENEYAWIQSDVTVPVEA